MQKKLLEGHDQKERQRKRSPSWIAVLEARFWKTQARVRSFSESSGKEITLTGEKSKFLMTTLEEACLPRAYADPYPVKLTSAKFISCWHKYPLLLSPFTIKHDRVKFEISDREHV